jgi:tetratricopeptide (TPR) repeat protein
MQTHKYTSFRRFWVKNSVRLLSLRQRERYVGGVNLMKINNLWAVRVVVSLMIGGLILAVSSCTSRSSDPIAAPLATEKVPIEELIKRADKAYEQRSDLAQVREALALLRNARTADFQNYDVTWRLARADYYLGAHSPVERERDNAFRDGVEMGEAAVKLQDGKPDGHFWFGANMGGRAKASSLSGLADAEDIRREMQTVIKLDEKFGSGSAYMVLGQVDLELPRLMGGDPQDAVKNLEKGLTFGPDNSLLRLHLAEAYLATGRNADARKQLDTLLSMKPNPNFVPEHQEASEEGRKLLETKF